MKLLRNIAAGVLLALTVCSSVFAAGASYAGKADYVTKGKVLSGDNITVTIGANEVEAMKDCISITLDGAKWDSYKDNGRIQAGVTYTKASDKKLELHLEPNETMLKSGVKFELPLKCTVTDNIEKITATINWGLPEYADREILLARVGVSYAYRDGDIKVHKKGDKIYRTGSRVSYNQLKIRVLSRDVERVRNKITVTLDGAEWSDYDKEGKVENNHSKETRYQKLDSRTLKIFLDDYSDYATNYDNYLTLPLTGTITGTGEIKAIVDFGVSDIKPSEVVFARCADGTVTLSSSSPQTPVDIRGRVSDVVINDTSTQGYGWDKKMILKLNLAYHFSEVPEMVCEGKFADKCKIEINKNDDKQCILHIYNAEKGSTGSITLKNVIIERPEVNVPNKEEIKMTLEASGWEEYESTAQIGKYTAGAAYFSDYMKAAANANSQANNDYAFLGRLTFTDNAARGYAEGDRIEMSVDSGFAWFSEGAVPAVSATGKFAEGCAFEFDKTNPAKAYIVFTKKIPANQEGTVLVDNAVLKKTDDKEFEKIMLTAGVESCGSENYVTVQTAKFSSLLTKVPETTTIVESTTEATTQSTDGNGVRVVGALTVFETIKEIITKLF